MSDPIRILHVVTHMDCGGLETMIMNYYRNMDRNKIQFDFLTHRPVSEKKYYDDEIKSLGGKIYHVSRLNPFSYAYRNELEKFFNSHKEYRIVHVHQDCMSGLILKIAKASNVPVRIAHAHSSNQDRNPKYLIKNLYKRIINKYATDLFACGKTAGEWMFGKHARFTVLPNAIDTNKYSFSNDKRHMMREKFGISEEAFIIGHVGRFSKVKNHRFVIELCERLLRHNQNTFVFFIGQGETMEEMKEIVNQKRLQNSILFLGLRNDVPDLMQAMDVFILPSLYEGLPVSVIEAQAAGLPCVISENVPLDCVITDLAQQVSLDISRWEDALLQLKTGNRKNTQEEIKNARFDIKENAAYLEKYYLSALEKFDERNHICN